MTTRKQMRQQKRENKWRSIAKEYTHSKPIKPTRNREHTRTIVCWNLELKPHEYTQRRMEFGKYKGQQIKNIPDEYIKWGVMNLDTTWASYFSRELQRRYPTLYK